MTTQSITPVLGAVQARTAQDPGRGDADRADRAQPVAARSGLPPVADVYIGTIDLPYYLNAPTRDRIRQRRCSGFWRAAPGAYVPPFNQFGLDPTSTIRHLRQSVAGGEFDPEGAAAADDSECRIGQDQARAGWPIVIFQHGITRNRSDCLRHRRHAGCARIRGRRDRRAAARHHRSDQSAQHRQHAVRGTRRA